jgi:hypothetical protein
MKKKQFSQLQLRKATVTHLSFFEQEVIKGGYTGGETCDTTVPKRSCQLCPVPVNPAPLQNNFNGQ